MKKESKFKYRRPTADSLSKRQSRGGDRESFISSVVTKFKPADGTNVLRVLPATWAGAEHYGLDVWVHYEVGANEAAYLCRSKMKNKKCPICEEAAKAVNNDDTEYANKLKPKRRVLVYVVDRDKEDEGVKLWSMPPTLDEELAQLGVDKRSGEVFAVDDPKEGYDFEFNRSGKGMNTRYTGARIARRPSKLGNKEWLEFAIDNPLPTLLEYHSYDEISQAFSGAGEDEDEDDDDAPVRHKSKVSGKKSKSSKYEDDDEDDDEDEIKSKKSSKAKNSKSSKYEDDEDEDDDEDSDSDDDEDDDDEDEQVARKKGSRGKLKKKRKDEDEDEDDDDEDEDDDDEDEDD